MLVKIKENIKCDVWYKSIAGITVDVIDSHGIFTSPLFKGFIDKDHADIVNQSSISPNPLNKTVITRIGELFEQKLQQKTGWGKNEVLETYRSCVTEAILEILD